MARIFTDGALGAVVPPEQTTCAGHVWDGSKNIGIFAVNNKSVKFKL